MQKAKKLIEVALPIKEISAESVRDKSIRHGHISTPVKGLLSGAEMFRQKCKETVQHTEGDLFD